jgi:hypothetical protein
MAANDPKDLIIPVSHFKANATLPGSDLDIPASYTIDFGSFEKGSLKVSGDLKKIFAALGGKLGLNAIRRVKAELTYEFELKHLSPSMLAYWMGSASGSAPAPGKVFELYCIAWLESEDEPIVPPTNSNEGAAVFSHYGFKAGCTLDGDFDADGESFGMLKLTANVYLGNTPGLWAAATRPVTATP